MSTGTIATGLCFGEAPRWRDDALWISDMHGNRVVRVTVNGSVTTIVEMPGDRPSGLGWLPDGRLLVVAMESKRLLRLEHDGDLAEHADLSSWARGSVNDMIVASDGTAYIGDMGGRLFQDGPISWSPGQMLRVRADGEVAVVADDLLAPNGCILSDDEDTLIVAESRASRISAFDVVSDGTLTKRRVFADIDPANGQSAAPPDGICLDAEGAVWVAEIIGRRLIRVMEGGKITDTVSFDGAVPIACVLGGPDRRTMFVCVADSHLHHDLMGKQTGRVVAFTAEVPGAGRP